MEKIKLMTRNDKRPFMPSTQTYHITHSNTSTHAFKLLFTQQHTKYRISEKEKNIKVHNMYTIA